MFESVLYRDATRGSARPRADVDASCDFMEWLRTGRLTLLDQQREEVGVDDWSRLPAATRARAIADFQRVVAPGTKAAVLFLQAH